MVHMRKRSINDCLKPGIPSQLCSCYLLVINAMFLHGLIRYHGLINFLCSPEDPNRLVNSDMNPESLKILSKVSSQPRGQGKNVLLLTNTFTKSGSPLWNKLENHVHTYKDGSIVRFTNGWIIIMAKSRLGPNELLYRLDRRRRRSSYRANHRNTKCRRAIGTHGY